MSRYLNVYKYISFHKFNFGDNKSGNIDSLVVQYGFLFFSFIGYPLSPRNLRKMVLNCKFQL